jgi:adenosyl cobinamide kinase/adenosyl cobinamide phosphate guanylyltransferase
MENSSNPYGRKTLNGDFGAYFNALYCYVEGTGVQPSVYEFGVSVALSTVVNLEKMGAERVFLCESEKHVSGEVSVNPMESCYRLGDVCVYLYRRESILDRFHYMGNMEDDDEGEEGGDEDEIVFRCKVLYPPGKDISGILAAVDRRPDRKKKGNVHLLCSMEGVLGLQRFQVRLPPGEMELDLKYGGEVASKFSKLSEMLSSDRGGLVLVSGDPGTGKSTFIKYLATQTSRKVIYLSSGAAEQITSPDFMSFIMGHRGSVLLLEDAEKALRSRETGDNWAISNILNITDGILGDCLNIMVIATFNIGREQIDPALVRKGRLLLEHHFEPLSAEEANRLLERMGSDRRTSEPMTLAEIYNPEDNFHEEREERRVGF